MEYLYGKDMTELRRLCEELSLPRFAAGQIARWLYRRHTTDAAAMTDLPAAARVRLAERCDTGLSAPVGVSTSSDGTKKYLFRTVQGHFIESAYIPDGDRATLCVSSQAGCRMGCRFCATGRQGLQHSLTAAEILNQIESLPERDRLTNIVFMGMGEPLDNPDAVLRAIEVLTAEWGFGWSPTRITLSTAGVTPQLRRLLDTTRVHLAVSLHNPFAEERAAIMPIERAYPIRELVDVLRDYDFTGQRRVSFEYILMQGLNDSPRHLRELCRLLNGLRCRINLIRFHRIPDSPYFSPDRAAMERFRDTLTARGITTTIRASRGEDIQAACGLLSTRGLEGGEAVTEPSLFAVGGLLAATFCAIFFAIRNKIPIFTKTKTICAMKLDLCTTAIGVALVLSLNAFGDSRTTPPL
ncbi:putative dual-specificity RNA methyltransferase RlmN [Alistipes communis]|uniref:Probable dual-specificity RNA methyltransferase RlmN n=1 Tax=Alistipes communis TaxID=2585118 RepID=A0A4Y1WS51_9BACT|nr:putative dual-specificity RNA methyltransferase RlmN [Alistipes communis]